MKSIFFVLLLFCTSINSFSQSKKDLEKQITTLNSENYELKNEIISLKNQLLVLKEELLKVKTINNDLLINSLNQSTVSNDGQSLEGSNSNGLNDDKNLIGNGRCQATTIAGKQCSRNADSESKYCWQHKKIKEPSTNQNKSTSNSYQNNSTTSSGRTIYTGSRGGKYYINSKGNKTYIKK